MRRLAAAVLAAAAVLGAATACGIDSEEEESVVGKDALVIGVSGDQPGLGERRGDGSFTGFDVDIAKEIARRMGVRPDDVTFRRVTSANREEMLQDGDADLVVSSYSITPERKVKVAFAGPYYVAHQDILVRRSEARAIRNIDDLKGRRLCRVPGSTSFPRVHDEQGVAALPVEASGYAGCLTELTERRLDAVSTDDLILAGLAAKAAGGGGGLTLANAPFSDEPYGVGIRKGDVDGCEAVNKAITRMYQDGTAPRLLDKWFRPAGLRATTTVPQFEGCV